MHTLRLAYTLDVYIHAFQALQQHRQLKNLTGRAGVYVYLHHMKPHRHAEGSVCSKGSFKDTTQPCPDAPDMCFTFRELVKLPG